MNNGGASESHSDGKQGANTIVWLISFSDLLTLLLCFFLCLAAFGRFDGTLRQANSKISQDNLNTNGVPNAASSVVTSGGTVVANKSIEAGSLQALLTEADFGSDGSEVKSSGQDKLKKLLETVAYKPTAVLIETCGVRVDRENERAWLQGMSRAVALKGQLLDAGIDGQRLIFRNVGPHCEVIEGGEVEGKGLAAMLTLREM